MGEDPMSIHSEWRTFNDGREVAINCIHYSFHHASAVNKSHFQHFL